MPALAADPTRLESPRAEALYRESQERNYRRTDRLFAKLMGLQWLAGIAAASWISPKAWAGETSLVHPHVWAAILLGGAITALPVFLAWKQPGRALTRHVIAVGQMLTSALLIHLSGGRLETHFHIFGSLAFLAFYRDWRVLLSATVVVTADHILRGAFWPQSIFGMVTASHWRWIEHTAWVVFEDVFLCISIRQSTREMRAVAQHRSELEASGERLARAQEVGQIGSWELDVATSTLTWSAEKYRLYGLSPDTGAVTREFFVEHIFPEDRAKALAWVETALASGGRAEVDYRIVRADGEVRTMHTRAELVLDDRRQVIRLLGTSQDITDRRRTEDKLEENRQFLAALLENVADGIVACDAGGVLTLFNRAARELHGLPLEPIPPEQWAEHFNLYLPDGKTLLQKEQVPLFRALHEGAVSDAEIVIKPANGDLHRLVASGRASSLSPIPDRTSPSRW